MVSCLMTFPADKPSRGDREGDISMWLYPEACSDAVLQRVLSEYRNFHEASNY
jgi:hypothetical protein